MKIKLELKQAYNKVFWIFLNNHMISFDLEFPFPPFIDEVVNPHPQEYGGFPIKEPKQIRTFFRELNK